MPTPATVPLLAKSQIAGLVPVAASLRYTGPESGPGEKFEGMSNIEVATIRQAEAAADGNFDELKDIRDRILGRPKQSVERLNINVTYEDKLRELAEAENSGPGVIDAEVEAEL